MIDSVKCPKVFRRLFKMPRAYHLYRREALIRNAQPERLDDPLRVTARHERVFLFALLIVLLVLFSWAAFAV